MIIVLIAGILSALMTIALGFSIAQKDSWIAAIGGGLVGTAGIFLLAYTISLF